MLGVLQQKKKNNQSNKQKTSKQQTNNKKNIASSLLPASAKQCWFFAGTQGPRVALTASSSTWYTLWNWIDEEKSSLSCGRVAFSHMLLPWPESLFSCQRQLDVTYTLHATAEKGNPRGMELGHGAGREGSRGWGSCLVQRSTSQSQSKAGRKEEKHWSVVTWLTNTSWGAGCERVWSGADAAALDNNLSNPQNPQYTKKA